MLVFAQFVYRLSFGLAAAMVVTSPRLVTSGYYRNNSYVLLGMSAAVAAASFGASIDAQLMPLWPAVVAAVAGYVAAVAWLYEKPRAGRAALTIVALATLYGSLITVPGNESQAASLLNGADAVAGGLLLGVTMAAMLLGHWYLNAPGMKLQPLIQLTMLIGVAVALRTIVSSLGLAWTWPNVEFDDAERYLLVLRWLAAVVGTAVLVGMTLSTLKIPNTQAATGMLYVAVITTFLGELVGRLLSVGRDYAL